MISSGYFDASDDYIETVQMRKIVVKKRTAGIVRERCAKY